MRALRRHLGWVTAYVARPGHPIRVATRAPAEGRSREPRRGPQEARPDVSGTKGGKEAPRRDGQEMSSSENLIEAPLEPGPERHRAPVRASG